MVISDQESSWSKSWKKRGPSAPKPRPVRVILILHIYNVLNMHSLSALKDTTSEAEKQLEQIDKLEQTLFELQGEIGGGRHLPPGVRVLSLRDNPASQWDDLSRKALDRMKEENEALLNRLKEVESQVGSGPKRSVADGDEDDLVPRKSFEVVVSEKEELEEMLKQKEKRLLRLKQVCLTPFL